MASINKIKGNGNRIKKDANIINKNYKKTSSNSKEKNESRSIKKEKKYYGYKDRLIMKFLNLLIMIIIFITSFYYSINLKNNNIYSYKEEGNIDYKVYLKPNNYYNVPFLNKNMQYISDIVNYIDTDFNYKLNFNTNSTYSYNYYVTGDLYIYEGTTKDKLLYQKTYNIINPVSVNNQIGNTISLNLNEKIDYNYYDQIAQNFTNQYGLITNSNLVVKFHVNVDSNTDILNDKTHVEGLSTMNIPLNTKTLGININTKDSNNYETFTSLPETNKINLLLLLISFISFIISVLTIKSIITFIYKTQSTKNKYQLTLDKILREYDRAIITAKSDYIIDNVNNFIDVSSFLELMDVHDNLDLPILYIEIAKGHKVWFVINSREGTYRYVLKNID